MRGKYITSHGYVMIKVPAGHHLAMTRGYAYEHRLIAEQKLGRRLKPNKEVHHINEDTTDNRPENLEVCLNLAEHKLKHRKACVGYRKPNERNQVIFCACGCGETLLKFYKDGRPRKFLHGHQGVTSHSKNPSLRLTAVTTYLKAHGPCGTKEIVKHTGESNVYVSSCLRQLVIQGRISRECSGKGRAFIWSLLKDKQVQF